MSTIFWPLWVSLLIWRTVGGAILGYRLHYNILKHMLLARPRPNFLHGNAMPVSMFGSCCELGEITPDSITESHLSGPHYRLTNNDSVPTVKESTRSDRGLQQSVENPVSIDSSISQSIRKNGSNSGGYCSGPDLLPQSPSRSDQISSERPIVPVGSNAIRSELARVEMVENLPSRVERQTYDPAPSRIDYNVRCVNPGVGAHTNQLQTGGGGQRPNKSII